MTLRHSSALHYALSTLRNLTNQSASYRSTLGSNILPKNTRAHFSTPRRHPHRCCEHAFRYRQRISSLAMGAPTVPLNDPGSPKSRQERPHAPVPTSPLGHSRFLTNYIYRVQLPDEQTMNYALQSTCEHVNILHGGKTRRNGQEARDVATWQSAIGTRSPGLHKPRLS